MSSNPFVPQIKRIREDIMHGGKMGQVSALRLLDIIEQMSAEIVNLRNRVERESKA